jgi:hypothetical protein
VIVKFQGGMANQMFEYAFGRSVSIAKNEELFFKKVELGPGHTRAYSLDCFNVDVRFTESEGSYIFDEKISNIYDPEVYTQPPDTYYRGVFQTERYFNIPVIRQEFTFKNQMSPKTLRVAEEILKQPSAFVHVRRSGDYGLPEIQAIFGGLDMRYYIKGMDYIRSHIPNVRFFVINDDPEWARANFPNDYVVGHNGVGNGNTGPSTEHEDLWLMSICDHAVIPSSSFGWMGAWLGDERRPRIVVVPEPWYRIKIRDNKYIYDSSQIIPDRWTRLSYE